MMPELSLNILDVAQNSVAAKARNIVIDIAADTAADRLCISIADDGCGMTDEQLRRVTDPFYTTRTTRKVGLGIPFLKMAAELTGGSLSMESEVGVGTTTRAEFGLSHIDRMPLGDIAGTYTALVGVNPALRCLLRITVDDVSFEADTAAFSEALGEDIPLSEPQVLSFITGYINENLASCKPVL